MIRWDKKFREMAPEKREYGLNWLVDHALSRKDWQRLDELLLNVFFLESKAETEKIFELADDFSKAVKIVARNHVNYKFYGLIEEAIRRDIHFIEKHPSTLFQCLWNSCWWYDCPDAAPPEDGWPKERPPWKQDWAMLYKLLEKWSKQKEKNTPGFLWMRSLRPPSLPLGSPQKLILVGHDFDVHHAEFMFEDQAKHLLIIFTASGIELKTWLVYQQRQGQKF